MKEYFATGIENAEMIQDKPHSNPSICSLYSLRCMLSHLPTKVKYSSCQLLFSGNDTSIQHRWLYTQVKYRVFKTTTPFLWPEKCGKLISVKNLLHKVPIMKPPKGVRDHPIKRSRFHALTQILSVGFGTQTKNFHPECFWMPFGVVINNQQDFLVKINCFGW